MQYVVKVVWQSVTLACTLLLAPKSGHLLIQVKKKSLLFFLGGGTIITISQFYLTV